MIIVIIVVFTLSLRVSCWTFLNSNNISMAISCFKDAVVVVVVVVVDVVVVVVFVLVVVVVTLVSCE